jgi:hypothetical protein
MKSLRQMHRIPSRISGNVDGLVSGILPTTAIHLLGGISLSMLANACGMGLLRGTAPRGSGLAIILNVSSPGTRHGSAVGPDHFISTMPMLIPASYRLVIKNFV